MMNKFLIIFILFLVSIFFLDVGKIFVALLVGLLIILLLVHIIKNLDTNYGFYYYGQGHTTENPYYEEYNYSNYDRYKPSVQYTAQINRPYYGVDETFNKKLMKRMIPNMSVILNDAKKQNIMMTAKQSIIDGTFKTKEKKVINNADLKPIEADLVYINNCEETSKFQEIVYKNTLKYFDDKKTKVGVIKSILREIKYIDIIDETQSVVFYISNLKPFEDAKIQLSDLFKYIKENCQLTGSIDYCEYKPTSILDVYENVN